MCWVFPAACWFPVIKYHQRTSTAAWPCNAWHSQLHIQGAGIIHLQRFVPTGLASLSSTVVWCHPAAASVCMASLRLLFCTSIVKRCIPACCCYLRYQTGVLVAGCTKVGLTIRFVFLYASQWQPDGLVSFGHACRICTERGLCMMPGLHQKTGTYIQQQMNCQTVCQT